MPRISVVVPAYNIERYLAECLQSIADQTVTDLEVLVVDDGSRDGTAAIAQDFADRDARFRVLRQANGGLGHARNEGAARVSGEFLSFVDGDDILPRRAYEILLGALDRTGSDFASGNVHRFTSIGTRQSAMFEEAFAETLLATHVSRHPDLLVDRIAPNKLWRREFWDRHGFRFPEGVLHEDIYVAISAHVLAHSVDVISEPCYLYRTREGTDLSITQRRLDPKAIRDRAHAVDSVSRFLAARGDRKLKRLYDQTCAEQDFRYTLERLDEADDAFRELFLDLVNDFFDRAHRHVFDALPAIDRLAYHLVRRRMMPELLEVLRFNKTRELERTRDVHRGRRMYAAMPYFDDPVRKIPRRLYRIDRELRMKRQVDEVRWEGTRLVIEGHAYISRVDMIDPADSTIRLTLETKTGQLLELPVERVARPDVTAAARSTVFDYTWSGFRTSVDVEDLLPERRSAKNTLWRMVVDVRASGRALTRRVIVAAPGRPQRPDVLTVGDVRVIPTTRSGRVGIHVDQLPVVIDAWRADGDVLELEGTVRSRLVPDLKPYAARLLLERETESGQLRYPVSLTPRDKGTWSLLARVPLSALTEAQEVADQASHAEDYGDGLVWTVSLAPGGGQEPVPAVADDGLPEFRHLLGTREALLSTTRTGRLTLIERGVRAVATNLRWTDQHELEISGDYPAADDQRLELVVSADGLVDEHVFPVPRDGSTFRVTVPVRAVPTLAGALPLPAGTWMLNMRKTNGAASTSALKIGRDVRRALPLADTAGRRTVVARYADFDSVRLDVGPDLLTDEIGGFNQHRLQSVEFPAFVRQGLRDAVLFESYGAVQYADNPRAIAEELHRRGTDLELLWAVHDEQTELPEWLTPVPRDSRAWYEATARARYVVTCVYRPLTGWLDPHPDQVVVQTWHGPPFKKIGFDSEGIERQARRGYHDRLARETSRWNYLVSPNLEATPILRSAFRYDGDVLETGYPRTDYFFRPDREQVAARVRAQLGIPEGKKVVLYAPTFRDNQQYRRNRFRLDLHLDLRDAERVLGDDHVLLVRRHAKIVDSLRGAGSGFVRDVSRYPDVNELLLLTDVLVSDYSSLMFDFADTGRPMVFFTYDLEQYRDEIRGFYFDLGVMPGPLLKTSAEVVRAVANADEVREKYDDTYQSFRERFCTLDDGTASARVVSAVFGADAGPRA